MKNFLKTVVALLVVVIIGVVFLVSRINTESNKQAIASAVLDATGYELVIGGDLSLDIFPTLGVSLDDVRLRNPAVPQELASTSRAVLRVPLASLARGEINVQEISADDFHVNYFIGPDGRSIWEIDREPSGSSEAGVESGSEDAPEFSIDRIRVSNASIDIQDVSRGSRFLIDELNLDSRDTNINGNPFSFEVSFDYENNGMSEPVPVNLQARVTADLNAGTVDLEDVRFSVTPMLISGQINLSDFNDSPAYSGTLSADRFDAVGLMQSLGLSAPDSAPLGSIDDNRMLAFDLSFSGDGEQATVPEFNLDLAGATISANADVRMATDFAPMSVSYNVNAGNLDLSPFFPESQEQEDTEESNAADPVNPAAQYQPETELPVELVNSLSLLGSIAIESITLNDYRFEDVNLFTNIEDGVMDVEVPPISAFEGSAQATLRLNAQAQTPEVNITFATSDINLVNLAPSVSRFNTVTGFLQSESTYTARGSTTSALMETLTGNTAYSISENSVDIGLIKQVFTAIAALSPTGEAIQQWPDVIRFNELGGYILLENGLESDQQMQLRMDNFDISGNGGVNLDAGTFEYDLAFTVLGEPHTQTIPINELYHDVSWPVDCSAAFSDEVSRYCRPDFTRVREIFTQIGTNAVRSEVEEAITDQVPEELQDTARGLLRSILN